MTRGRMLAMWGEDEMMSIGRFARVSGLSVHTLRRYDDVGILTPAEVDPDSGYRRYRRDQVHHARLIQALRWIDLPVEEIRTALDDNSGDAIDGIDGILRRHRRHLERRESLVAGQIADIDYYLEKGLSMTPASGTRPVQLEIAVHDIDEAIAFYQQAEQVSSPAVDDRIRHGNWFIPACSPPI